MIRNENHLSLCPGPRGAPSGGHLSSSSPILSVSPSIFTWCYPDFSLPCKKATGDGKIFQAETPLPASSDYTHVVSLGMNPPSEGKEAWRGTSFFNTFYVIFYLDFVFASLSLYLSSCFVSPPVSLKLISSPVEDINVNVSQATIADVMTANDQIWNCGITRGEETRGEDIFIFMASPFLLGNYIRDWREHCLFCGSGSWWGIFPFIIQKDQRNCSMNRKERNDCVGRGERFRRIEVSTNDKRNVFRDYIIITSHSSTPSRPPHLFLLKPHPFMREKMRCRMNEPLEINLNKWNFSSRSFALHFWWSDYSVGGGGWWCDSC